MTSIIAESRRVHRHNPIYIGSGIVFLFFTMFLPDSFKWFRLVLLMLLFASATVDIFTNNFPLGKGIVVLYIYLVYNFFACILGLIEGAPGALRSLSVDILWPVSFYLIGMTLNSERDYAFLLKYMILFTVVLGAFDLWYCLGNLGLLPLPGFFVALDLDLRFGYYGSFIQYMNTHQATFIFMTPFTVALLFDLKKIGKYIHPFWVIIAFSLELACLLMSGRVALQVVSALSLVFVMFFRFFLHRVIREIVPRKKKNVLPSFYLIILVLLAGLLIMPRILSLDIGKIWDYIANKFSSSISESDNVRLLQFNALMSGWLESPIFGHGTGSYTTEVVREIVDQPWAYELSYCALLFQKGLVGFVIFFVMVLWILHAIWVKIKRRIYPEYLALPFLIGFICFLIANAADPYLSKFGYMWVLFIPFAMASSEWTPGTPGADKKTVTARK